MNLQVTSVPLADLKPWPGNARQGDVGAIVESLRHHGQYRPLVVQASTGHVIAGNHTLQAARELGWQDIAVTMLDVDDDQAQRINIVDNRTQDLATNDEYALAQLLRDLAGTEDGLAGTGYDGDDLDDLLTELEAGEDRSGQDTDPGEPPEEPRTKPGDVWVMGDHRLVCGDATSTDDVDLLFADGACDMVFTDPPYGVNVSGAGGRAIAGDLGNVAITGFFPLAVARLKPGHAIYLCGGASNVPLYFKLYELNCRQLPTIIVWVKESFVLRHHDYHSQYELIYYGWRDGGKPSDRWHGDRKQSDVWNIKRDNAADYEHPTQKPVELPERALRNTCRPGGIVYEPFGGSGSTLIAAENVGRRCFALEIDPGYCDVIVDRWERHTGKTAVLEERDDG